MDQNQQVPLAQAPIVEHSSQQFPLIPVLALGSVMLIVGLAGGYFLASKNIQGTSVSRNITNTVDITPTNTPAASPTPESASAMNTYQNQELGISFQYPQTWKTTDPYGTPSTTDFVGLLPQNKQRGDTVTPIYVEYFPNPQNLSLSAYESAQDAKQAMPLNLYSPTDQATSVGGFPAYINERADCEPLLCERVIVMAENSIFVFYNVQLDQSYSTAELGTNKEIFNQMLQTVTFTH